MPVIVSLKRSRVKPVVSPIKKLICHPCAQSLYYSQQKEDLMPNSRFWLTRLAFLSGLLFSGPFAARGDAYASAILTEVKDPS
jgi:hypothetical protein